MPRRSRGGTRPAVCGSWQMTRSPSRTRASMAIAFSRATRSKIATWSGPSGEPSPDRAVDRVVDALGHTEKVRRPLDDEPASIYAQAADVAQDRVEHLGDPSARGRGIDVPHGASTEQSDGPFRLHARGTAHGRGPRAFRMRPWIGLRRGLPARRASADSGLRGACHARAARGSAAHAVEPGAGKSAASQPISGGKRSARMPSRG